MTIKTSSLGGGGLPRLAPNLSWPSTPGNGLAYQEVTGIDASGALTQVLSLVGKFNLSYLQIVDMVAETTTVKLTVDGEVKMDDIDFVSFATCQVVGSSSSFNTNFGGYEVRETAVLEVKKATDGDISVRFSAVPIM